jgi:hypothetical protein
MKSIKTTSSSISLLSGILGMILYFPLWWYSLGFYRFAKRIFLFWREQAYSLAVLIWIKNIFVPMYGQGDFVGRLISFGVRLVQIIARSFILFLWLIFCTVLIISWLALPILIILATIIQLS